MTPACKFFDLRNSVECVIFDIVFAMSLAAVPLEDDLMKKMNKKDRILNNLSDHWINYVPYYCKLKILNQILGQKKRTQILSPRIPAQLLICGILNFGSRK